MKKVLIVEDCKITRAVLKKVVQSEGLASVESSNGKIALSILHDNTDFDLVITDMMMPELSGRDLILTMQGDEALKNIPVMVVSGVVPLSEISDLLKLGAYRFLPKPIDSQELRSYLQKLSEQSSLRLAR